MCLGGAVGPLDSNATGFTDTGKRKLAMGVEQARSGTNRERIEALVVTGERTRETTTIHRRYHLMKGRTGRLLTVDRTISTITPASPAQVYDIVADLGTYQHWLSLIHKVEFGETTIDGQAWWVTLRAKIGPFARSKRLRMVRVVNDSPSLVRFERRELDDRDHSAWIMQATVADGATPEESVVEVTLNYDGALWNGVLDSVLGGAIDSAIGGLRGYVADST